MTKTLQESLNAFAGHARPLRTLTKEQLFIYPAADPSQEAGFKFTREVMHRRAFHNAVAEAVTKAKERLDEAHLKMVKNPDLHAPLEKQVNIRKRELAIAQGQLADLANNPQALSHEEVQADYRRKHLPEYEAMIAKWHALDLFDAQRFGWVAFLTCDRDTRRSDQQTFLALQTLAAFCGEDRGPTFLEINAMNAYRISPRGAMRRRFLNEEGDLITPAALDADLKKIYWEAWRAYNTATVTHKWPDDSGAAYDERIFKITTHQED